MRRTFASRLEALERSASGGLSIPIVFVDADGRAVGEVPPRPLQPFDYATVAAELLAAMGYEDEAFCG